MLRILLVVFVVLFARPALGTYTSFYVFGDSLSDAGNAFALAGNTFLPPPYAQRFSNGPVAAEYLASNLGVTGFRASALGGTDYAVGGATTGAANFNFVVNNPPGLPATIAPTGMALQVGGFLATGPALNPGASLFMVWGGPNDFFLGQALGADPGVTASTAVSNLAGEVAALALAGAQRVIVPNMPNLGTTPFGLGSGQAAQLAALTSGFNAGLAAAMALVEQATGVDVILFDTFAFLAQVLANPGSFAITNTTGRCIDSLQALQSNCQGYLFFDSVHPTTWAHQLLAERMYVAVVSEPSAVLLALAWLLSLGWILRRSERRVAR